MAETVSRRVVQRNNTSNAGQGWRHGHGQENPRRHYQPDLIRRWKLDRGSSATYHRSGGNQPAYQSMINLASGEGLERGTDVTRNLSK